MNILRINGAGDLERKLSALHIGYGKRLSNDGRLVITLCDGRIGIRINERKDLIENPLMVMAEGGGEMACGTVLFKNLTISISDHGDVTLVLLNSIGVAEGLFALRVSQKAKEEKR